MNLPDCFDPAKQTESKPKAKRKRERERERERGKIDPYSDGKLSSSTQQARRGGLDLATYTQLFPTPIASDWKNRGCKDARQNRQCQLQTTVGGQLNPTWVEWLMGFPLGWTDLDASEMPSCPSSTAPSSAP